ncbi:MAG: glycosyltransferase family 4 protein [Promethearchaeota archaeon]
MKVIHTYIQHPGQSGSNIFFDELSNEMRKKGHKVSIITSDLKYRLDYFNFFTNPVIYKNSLIIKRIPFTILRYINSRYSYSKKYKKLKFFDRIIFIIELKLTKFLKNISRVLKFSLLWGLLQDELGWKMYRFLRKENCDLIHTTSIPRSCITSSLLVAKQKKIPIMITPFYHFKMESYFLYDNLWMSILNKFDIINVCTNAEKDYLIKHGVDKRRIVKIGLGIYIQNYKNTERNYWRNKLDISEDKFVVLYINPEIDNLKKGILQVLGAALNLPSIEFIFAGKDNKAWNRLISNYFPNKKMSNCYFIGYVSGEEKSKLFNDVDLVVRPSINEALGIIYLEGLSAGKPIITSNIESMKEISENVGYTVEHGNIVELVELIQKLKMNISLYKKLSRNALQKVKNYSWENISKKFDTIYKILTNRYK